MIRSMFLSVGILMGAAASAETGRSMQDMILRETEAIEAAPAHDSDALAHLYASRAESYVLAKEYESAVEDFEIAKQCAEGILQSEGKVLVAFRIAFGEVICFDNLGRSDLCSKELENLAVLTQEMRCKTCLALDTAGQPQFHMQRCGEYDFILGPDQEPRLGWCDEVVIGTGRAMDAIACLAPSYPVKIALIGVIEALIQRGLKCCQTGNFWKACVAPITKKYGEWNNLSKKVGVTSKTLEHYY